MRLTTRVEELNGARSEQARQLAEARVRVQSTAGRERRGEAEGRRELQQLQEQLSRAKEIEQKASQQNCFPHFIALTIYIPLQLSTFQEAAQRLLSCSGIDSGDAKGDAPSNYDLIAQLERLVADHKELQETVKCLGSSLKELEQGFKTGYTNTLTILKTKA